jgi:hypothetical protein
MRSARRRCVTSPRISGDRTSATCLRANASSRSSPGSTASDCSGSGRSGIGAWPNIWEQSFAGRFARAAWSSRFATTICAARSASASPSLRGNGDRHHRPRRAQPTAYALSSRGAGLDLQLRCRSTRTTPDRKHENSLTVVVDLEVHMVLGSRHQDPPKLWSASGRPTHTRIRPLADRFEHLLELAPARAYRCVASRFALSRARNSKASVWSPRSMSA